MTAASSPVRGAAVVVVHPLRRHAAQIEGQLRRLGEAAGAQVRIERTTPQRPGAQQAAEAAAAGAARVIAVGGDGTVRSVASGLIGTGVPLGIVATGTADLFARNLGLRPPRTRRALRTALRRAIGGEPAAHDVGRLSWCDAEGRWHRELFLAVAGLGEDAAVVAGTDEALKSRAGWPAYLLRGAGRLRAAPHRIRVRADDGPELELPAWSVLIGSAPRIPLGVRVFPTVRTDSGDLELLRAAPTSLGDWAGIGWHGLTRRPQRAAALHFQRVRAVELRPRTPLLLQADGDLLGSAVAVQAQVDPGALLVAS